MDVVYIQKIEFLYGLYIWLERWGAGVETQKNVRGEIGGWGPPYPETPAPAIEMWGAGVEYH